MTGYDGNREMLQFLSEFRPLAARFIRIFPGQLGLALLWPVSPQAVQDCTDLSNGFEFPSVGVTQIFFYRFCRPKKFLIVHGIKLKTNKKN